MQLVSIILENFRGYHLKHEVLIDKDFTGIIGKNDVGKSTILEALDIFFENSNFEKNDKCIFANEDEFPSITCVFNNYPKF